MNITVRGLNFKVHEKTEEYAVKKLERLERYMPRIRDIRLELSFMDTKRGEDFTIAQLTVVHDRGAILRTEEKSAGMSQTAIEVAINESVDKMYRRIERFLGKRQDHRRHRSRFSATLEELELAEEMPEEAEELAGSPYEEFEYVEPEVVRHKQVAVEAMTENEAIEQMELLGHAFFMFLNGETNKINVLYRRDEGNYGVLVPTENG